MSGPKFTRSFRLSWWPPRPPWITMVLVSILVLSSARLSTSCGPGIKSPGVTVPRGDIIIEYGSGVPLEITCVLDPENELVASLLHDRNDDDDDDDEKDRKFPSQHILFLRNSEPVPKQFVTIVNSTAAHLRIPNIPAGHYIYSCTLSIKNHQRPNHTNDVTNVTNHNLLPPYPGDPSIYSTVQPTSLETSGPPQLASDRSEVGVCLNSVTVGYKPGHITDLTCISKNWESLTCNWTNPDNPIKTKYKIFFRLPGRAGGRITMNCPEKYQSENSCYWSSSTEPIYRQGYEHYYFTINGMNPLGNSSTNVRFHHWANVIPDSPINITVVDKTQSSAMLRWSVGPMSLFPPKLIHKIEYKSQWDSNPEHWHSVNVSEVCNSSLASNQTTPSPTLHCREPVEGFYCFNVTNLKYPFTHYDFRIYVRSSLASDDKWSSPGCVTLKTKPTLPRRPPRTDIGSFECVTSSVDKSLRDVYIYWQNIDDSEKCGDSFEYRASYGYLDADNTTNYQFSKDVYRNYAKFEGLSYNVGYNFTVYSVNKEGLSANFSYVYVPSESDRLEEPLSFTKMAFDDRGVFELSWKNASRQKLSTDNQINDYTLFWCESDKDRPYQCNGYMNWLHVPGTESCHNITVSDHMKIYQFAISANSKILPSNVFSSVYGPTTTSSSSGMVWASCTVLHNKIVGKIKNVWVNNIGPTFMELRWKLDCSDRIGAVLGFRIFYCPVVSINNSACKEPMLNKTVGGEMAQDSRGVASVRNLKPYSTYMVTIALITKHGEGLHSDPLLNTTLEGAPDIQNITINVSNLTNTTVSLDWSAPKFPNGVVRHYYVEFYLDNEMPQQQDLFDSQLINERRRIMVYDTKCLLEHLECYRTYKIFVIACTTVCSNRSSPVSVRTAVGQPGVIEQPEVSYENSTRIIVLWKNPAKPSGPVDFYELQYELIKSGLNIDPTNDIDSPTALASTQLYESSDSRTYKSESKVYRVPVPDCKDENENKAKNTYAFKVRAVNRNPLNPAEPYYGEWSTPGMVSCVLPGLSLTLHIVIWSCCFIVLSSVSSYLGNRAWKKYKFMHNVQVVLPPKLNINFKFDQYNNFSENKLESEKYCTDDEGRVVYDDSPQPADDAAVMFNANATDGSEDRNVCSSGSASSERLPTAAGWSPVTATTTVTAGGDDEDADGGSSSSKRQLIPPTKLSIAVKQDEENSGKTAEEDLSPVRPTEPVPLFFTLPDMPPLPPPNPVRVTPRNWDCGGGPLVKRNSGYCKDPRIGGGMPAVPVNRGYQDSGMIPVASNRYQDRPTAPNRLHYRHALPVSVDSLVGDQRQLREKTGVMPVLQLHTENQPLPSPPMSPHSTTDDDSTESRPSTDDDHKNVNYQSEREDGTSSPQPSRIPTPPPLYQLADVNSVATLNDRQPQQQWKPNNGYCSKDMLIAAPAFGAFTRNKGNEPLQQQQSLLQSPKQQQPLSGLFTQPLLEPPRQFRQPLHENPGQFSQLLLQTPGQMPEPQQLPLGQSPELQQPPSGQSMQSPEPQQLPPGQLLKPQQSPEPQQLPPGKSPEPQQLPPGQSPEPQKSPQEQSPEPQQPPPVQSPESQQPHPVQSPEPQQPPQEQSPELQQPPPVQSPEPLQPPQEQSSEPQRPPPGQSTLDIVPPMSPKSYVMMDIAAKKKRLPDQGRSTGYVKTMPGGVMAVISVQPDTTTVVDTVATVDHGLATQSDHHNAVQVAAPS